jgi:hypothetical protein
MWNKCFSENPLLLDGAGLTKRKFGMTILSERPQLACEACSFLALRTQI